MYSRFYPFILATITSLLTVTAVAQSPGIEWQKALGNDTYESVGKTLLTSDNSFIVAGLGTRSGTGSDIHICKVTQDGKVVWNKYYGGSASESFLDLAGTPDGGYVLTAYTLSSNGDVVGFHGTGTGSNYDVWVVKLSATGAIQWQRTIGGSSQDLFTQTLVQSDGSIYVLGTTTSSDGNFPYTAGSSYGFLFKFNASGTALWNNLVGSSNSAAKKMIIKPNGNILVGSVNNTLGNHGLSDIAVSEFTSAGAVVYVSGAGSWGGSGIDNAVDMAQTGVAQYTLLATTDSQNGDIVGAHGSTDLWLVTFDNNRQVIWKKALGGSGLEQNPSMYYNAADSTMLLFSYTSSNDGDVSGNHGGADIWAVKLSNAGNILWQRCLGGSGTESFKQAQTNAANEIFVLGTTASSDGDVTGYHGGTDCWFVKLTSSGSLTWQKSLGGSLAESPVGFNQEADGGFTLLTATPSKDGDVQGMHYKSDTVGSNITYNSDAWVTNLSSSGTLNWQKTLGGSGVETPGSVFNINGKYFVTTATSSNDGDVSNATGSSIWIVRLGLSNIIKGNVFIDLNANGIKDPGEPAYNDVTVKSTKNNYLRWSIPYNGQFKNEVDTGSFTTTATLSSPYYTITPVAHQSAFNTYFSGDSVDFAVHPIPGKRDVAVNIINTTSARPGFNSTYSIYYKNLGTDTIAAGKVYMITDTLTTLVSTAPVTDSVRGDTLYWSYSNLPPNTASSITVTLGVKASPKVNIGDVLQHRVIIDPQSGDLKLANNQDTIKQVVVGSYDPNNKSENHAGHISLVNITNGDALGYVVNFQNTGTDTAFTVIIRDTLNAKLDWSTLQITGASHPWSLAVTDGNKCAWTFSNINLPPVGTNEPASHGFIAFTVKPASTLVLGDTIPNTASIYFDYNLPVVTNKVTTVVQPDAVAQPVITGLVNNYCTSEGTKKIKVLNLPDNSTTVAVKLDNSTLTVAADSSISLAVASLTAGSHTLTITYTNAAGTKTTTGSFTVMVAVNPDVNVSANILQVVNLSNPVIVTAANASGGGKDPLFTFAWNNSFTNIIQTESSNNTLTITPTTLAIGDNKVYVKMKTSEVCYTAQTNIDSITIRRDQSTGITDVDYPNQVITAYPNPFSGSITISGLNSAKAYIVTMYNLSGQVVFSKRVTNRYTFDVNQVKTPAGIYWLTLFDDKKQKIIGSFKLIKQ